MAKALGTWPRTWGLGQVGRCVAKAVEALPTPCGRGQDIGAWPRPWGRELGLGGVAKAVRAKLNPNHEAVGA